MTIASPTENPVENKLGPAKALPHTGKAVRPASAKPKENEWWTADQVTGLSTLYYANGTIVGLAVTVPPAIATEPALPADPPTTSTCPYLPLFDSARRGPITDAKSRAVITLSCSDETIASVGEPISAMCVVPAVRELKTCAGRAAVKVMIESARAIVPFCGPIASASAPEGMSTATTGA